MLNAASREGTRKGAVATTIEITAHATTQQELVIGLETREVASWRQVANDYVALTKPKIISLLLVTTFGAMMIAGAGFPSPWIVLWTLIGGALASGGAGAVNHFIDRDIDTQMGRTKGRPVATGRISPRNALIFGIALEIASFALLTATVNLLSAALALGGYLFYVLVYTLWLKRSTPQNIVIGGAAGAFPPLVGWAAVTGNLSLGALVLFAIVFFWTPPHFWALALLIRGDYERANVPMLPVVRGVEETRKQILIYTVIMIATTLLLIVTHTSGLVYLLLAIGLGGWFLYDAIRLLREQTQRAARRLYLYSLLYLALLFVAMVIDHALVM
jgi:protoheme IX farnesyltransferase